MTDTRGTSTQSNGAGQASGRVKPSRRSSIRMKPVAAARSAIKSGSKAVRSQANAAAEAGADAIDNAPLTVLAGAIAVGAVVAALLPNTTREVDAIGPLGGRVRGALDDAYAAAKSAGSEQLTARGLTAAATTSGITTLVGAIIKAALDANKAADTSMRAASKPDKRTSPPQGS